jgi:signal transduction histidine kinase
MNSLRARLVLGFAVVSLIPIALGFGLLARQLRQTVRAQAAERLSAAVAVLEQQMRSDGERMAARLALLARDPELKRAYLVRTARDGLEAYLADRRILLGLDYLAVLGPGGEAVVLAAPAGRSPGPAALAAAGAPGTAVVVRDGDAPALLLAAGAPILYQGGPAGALRGGTRLDAGFLARLARAGGLDLELRDGRGRLVAFTPDGAGPASGGRRLQRGFAIGAGPEPRPTLTALASPDAAERAIGALQTTAGWLAIAGVAVAVALGALWSRSVSRPVERLAAFSQRMARGEWDEPLAERGLRELEVLVDSLERMRRDLGEYRRRLVASERHAAWSLMARQVAHEVRNPLTPIAVSVADLRRSYEQGRPDFPQILEQATRTIAEEVHSLQRMLQEFSEFGRLPRPSPAPCRAGALLAGLSALYAAEVSAGRLVVERPEPDPEFVADAGQIVQALVNLVQNGLEAAGGSGRVRVSAIADGDPVRFEVADDGPGIAPEQRTRLFQPDFSTRPRGSGLGLTMVERIAIEHGGAIAVDSEPGRGTTFRLSIPARPPAA